MTWGAEREKEEVGGRRVVNHSCPEADQSHQAEGVEDEDKEETGAETVGGMGEGEERGDTRTEAASGIGEKDTVTKMPAKEGDGKKTPAKEEDGLQHPKKKLRVTKSVTKMKEQKRQVKIKEQE